VFSIHMEEDDVPAALGRQAILGLESAGVTAIVKHMPGHGPALDDSHDVLPRISLSREALDPHLAPFRELSHMYTWGMVSHLVYEAFDHTNPAPFSSTIVEDVIRQRIGFDGVLITDDLYMGALMAYSPQEKAERALGAGCDLLLYAKGGVHTYQQAVRGLKNWGGYRPACLTQLALP
jgi:beta-N-acetylhexosaminidase